LEFNVITHLVIVAFLITNNDRYCTYHNQEYQIKTYEI